MGNIGLTYRWPNRSELQRFEEFFVKSDNCWEWTGYRDNNGYGRFDGKLAHRKSYQLYSGEIGAFHVCHRCDNPCCVNPSHLFLGTMRDNVNDALKKGRPWGRKPELSNEDYLEIKSLLRANHLTQEGIALKFGVSKQLISKIHNGKIKHASAI